MRLPRRHRSARTGRYVTHAEAQANRDTTVTETYVDARYLMLSFHPNGEGVSVKVRNGYETTNQFDASTYQQALALLGAVLDSEAQPL